ncbi:RiPP maturation radical SAM C-methyltransferase [Citrobacter portucalensis]
MIDIVIPPFASLEFPSLDAAVATQVLREMGISVNVNYINQDFSELIGSSVYTSIANIPPTRGVADWIGTGSLSRSKFPDDTVSLRTTKTFADYIKKILDLTDEQISQIYELRELWEYFSPAAAKKIYDSNPTAVFIVCRHQQLGATIRLAKAIRALGYQKPIIIFGQYFSSASQAKAIMDSFSEIDGVIFQGGAATIKNSLPAILSLRSAPGFLARNTIATSLPANYRTGNLTATPDYENYFERYYQDPLQSVIPFQASHGCWWADKRHCIFCGLIEEGQKYLEKESGTALKQILELVNKHEAMHIVHADHLLSKKHERELLPFISDLDLDITLFFEIKASTSKATMKHLVKANTYIVEIGIESFDTEVLSLIQKGTTALKNIRILKWAQELAITPYWTLMYGLPGETEKSLQTQIEKIKKISHLQPPLHATPVRLERDSLMFKNPEMYGIEKIKPIESALHTYPISQILISGFCRLFNFEYKNIEPIDNSVFELQDLIKKWKQAWHPNKLYYRKGPGFVKICDIRSEPRTITLRGWRMAVFLALDDVQTLQSLFRLLQSLDYSVSQADIQSFLSEINDINLIQWDANKLISLVPRVNLLQLQSSKLDTLGLSNRAGGDI